MEKSAKYKDEYAPEYYRVVAQYYADSEGPYLLGDRVTYADFAIYQSIDNDARTGTLPVLPQPCCLLGLWVYMLMCLRGLCQMCWSGLRRRLRRGLGLRSISSSMRSVEVSRYDMVRLLGGMEAVFRMDPVSSSSDIVVNLNKGSMFHCLRYDSNISNLSEQECIYQC